MPSSSCSWLKGVFVWSLEHALKTTGKAAHGLPYEFRALEAGALPFLALSHPLLYQYTPRYPLHLADARSALLAALINVVTALETDLNNMRSHVVELLAHMEENIDRDNLRLLLHYSRKLSIFQKRATLVQECLDELLANGASARSRSTTPRAVQCRRRVPMDSWQAAVARTKAAKRRATSRTRTDAALAFRPQTTTCRACTSQPRCRASLERLTTTRRSSSSSRPSRSSARRSSARSRRSPCVPFPRSLSLSLSLPDSLAADLRADDRLVLILQANVRHTEDIVELILDANRNSLLGLDLRVSIMTLGLTAGAMVAALFGMVRRPFSLPLALLSRARAH